MTKMNNPLLKNPANTLTSDFFNFLQLISLNNYKNTNTWKKMVKCYPFSKFQCSLPAPFGIPKISGPLNRTISKTAI